MNLIDMQSMRIAVAANFTAEPLADSLNFWSQKLLWQADVQFAPYNQIFQQLLDPTSLLARNTDGINVVLVRHEDWCRYEGPTRVEDSPQRQRRIEQSTQELIDAIKGIARSGTPCLLCLCPPSPERKDDAALRSLEQLIHFHLSNVTGVHLLTHGDVDSQYPVGDYYDANRDEMGHIPYTTEFFAALGTAVVRKIQALRRAPYKVIVADCDETLWKGVCGESGPLGIEIDESRAKLQQFLVSQYDAGMLLCLCSKNNAEDVEKVFACQTQMPLKRKHIVASRVNWRPKPENLIELASELQLGLDSFIFIDDNPLECEQVKSDCPEVLTLRLPESADQIPRFLANVWAFDKQRITDEDRRRNAFYRENVERDRFRSEVPTLENFLAGLQLRIDIVPLTAALLPRVSQLTHRTNQFNSTTLRRSEEQVRQPWSEGALDCLTVTVSDRFGEYGLVGAMLYSVTEEALSVNSFLLSCRVLGRGVEHAMLRKLGSVAISRGVARVDIQFIPSKKNSPALNFLEGVAAQFKEIGAGVYWYRVPSGYAAEVWENRLSATSTTPTHALREEHEVRKSLPAAPSGVMQEIATRLSNAQAIVGAIRDQRGSLAVVPDVDANTQAPIELTVLETWREVLGATAVNFEDDFFALGGDSLLATQVISRLRQVCGVRLHLRDIFDSPTIRGLADVIRELRKKSRSRATADVSSSIPRRTTGGPCALSFAQQRWWFLNQWAPGTADHLSLVLRFKGEFPRAAFEQALTALTERHEVLRTHYVLNDGSPVQVITPPAFVPLAFVDMSHVAEVAGAEEMGKILEQQFRGPFDLVHDPILRPTLLEFSNHDHVLVLVMHHIASDGWSRGILLEELQSLYTACVGGKEAALPQLPVQYADFALWQRDRMSSGDLNEQLLFWKRKLAGAPSILELPTDRRRPKVQDLRQGVHIRVCSNGLLEQLHNLSQQEGATLFMTLLAGYLVLLYRYTGQQDLVVGSPVAGRTQPDVERLIGCFINMVAFRNQVADEQSFSNLLAQVRRCALEAQDNQDIPFEKLVEELERGRDMSRAPIFQVVFALENLLPTPNFPGLQVDLREEETRSAFHDLSLFVAEQADGLRLRFEYRTDLFDASTIERMSAHFQTLLEAAVINPKEKVGALPIVNAAERSLLLDGWNNPHDYPVHDCIHQLFEQQVRRVPQNVALTYEGQTLSYGELGARANQLARYLMGLGVGPDVLVGLCAERSLDVVVGILGILKAGGAYLPLDPRSPKERIAFMLEDAKPAVLLTQYELRDSLPDVQCHVVALDADWSEIEREEATNLSCSTRPDNLAYVIYTSGSTGLPKGCQVTHANVVRLFYATDRWFGFAENDVWTMFHSYAFDFSVWEMWGALLYGGRLVIIPYLMSRSPEEFYRLLVSEHVTVLNQTPSSFRQLMHAEERLNGSSALALRYVIFGGEALEMPTLRSWFERHGDRTPLLVNMYGITETTVHVTYRPLSMQDAAAGSVIGGAISDLQVYLLDRNLQPAPIGVPGEIYVGGAGVARGYLNRPHLDAERFIPNIFRPGEESRLYKSGDLARRMANGDIEYMGRIDDQVKIRGFRIELGEIESTLAKHPAVRESVVTVSEESGEKRLVAYLVLQGEQALASSQLHAFLKEKLPEYMIPSVFVQLQQMPLTSNGKIDRQALLQADTVHTEASIDYLSPRTPLEEEMAEIWSEVLGLDRVGIEDNFFEIGGHSLLATRVIVLSRSRLGLDVTVRVLFENPTVAGMASALMEELLEQSDEPEVADIIGELEGLSDQAVKRMRVADAGERDAVAGAGDLLFSKGITEH
ncbi:MAG: amino acid adenylation domain-containing protein [Acidobacteriota bacterium]|nr:amino acid adenylation domain-containing protein [Acidobacteriota bacterium]